MLLRYYKIFNKNIFYFYKNQYLNCYKIILDCNNELEKFYAKSGLIKSGIQMGLYF